MRRIVRISDKVDKITLLDWIFHLIGIHCIRKSSQGVTYCRICGKTYEN